MTRVPTDIAEVHRAIPELIALALAVRPDWRERDVRAALAGAAAIGWSWEQTLTQLARLLVDGDAHARDLVPAWRSPLRRGRRPQPDDVAHRGAARARQALAETRAGSSRRTGDGGDREGGS